MRTERRAWRPRPITLTPLIDIIFLLLLFFMLSSTFTRFSEVPLLSAGAGTPTAHPPVFVQLDVDEVRLNGTRLSLDTLVDGIADLNPEGEQKSALVTLSGEVTSQRLVDLLAVLRGVPWLSVSVLG
jgi:biopolymer transport protein ExbD